MVPDEKFVYEERFKAKQEMYGKIFATNFFLSVARKIDFDSLMCARNIFSSYLCTKKRLFTNGAYKLRGRSIYITILCGPYR